MGIFISRNASLPFARPTLVPSYTSMQNAPFDEKPLRLDGSFAEQRRKYAKEPLRLVPEIDLPMDIFREIFSMISVKVNLV